MEKQNECTLLLDELEHGRGLEINKLRQLYLGLDSDAFLDLIEKIDQKQDKELTGQFIYFLTLFREEPHIQHLLEQTKIPLNIIEYLIISFFVRAFFEHKEEFDVLNRLLGIFDQDVYVDLLMNSEIIQKDRMLKYHIVSLLDRKHLDIFFNSHPDILNVLKGLLSLPEKYKNDLFEKNIHFYGYVNMFLKILGEGSLLDEFNKGQGAGIVPLIKDLIMEIDGAYNVELEKGMHLGNRNRRRIAHIVKIIKKYGYNDLIISKMRAEGVIIDKEEESLINEILHNPLFKNVLKRYTELDLNVIPTGNKLLV